MVYSYELDNARGLAYEKIVDFIFSDCNIGVLHSANTFSIDLTENNNQLNFKPIIDAMIDSTFTENYGMQVFAIKFKLTNEVKEYFLKSKTLNTYFLDNSKHFSNDALFADLALYKNNDKKISYLTHEDICEIEEGYSKKIRTLYNNFIVQDKEYLEIINNYNSMNKKDKLFFLKKGYTIFKNLIIYIQEEKGLQDLKNGKIKYMFNGYLPKNEWVSIETYKKYISKLYTTKLNELMKEINNFTSITKEIKEEIYKCNHYFYHFIANNLKVKLKKRSMKFTQKSIKDVS